MQDWELDQLVGLLGFLYKLQFGGDGEDTLFWEGLRAKGVFSVLSFYRMLEGGGVGVFPWKNIWAVRSPSKIAFFVWTTALNRILTIDNLIRRRHVLVNWCCMCCRDAETVDHLLVHCPVVSQL